MPVSSAWERVSARRETTPLASASTRARGPGWSTGANSGASEDRWDTTQLENSMTASIDLSERAIQPPAPGTIDYKLEVLTIPVSDVDRAKAFYASLGWREDADFPIRDGFRVIQMTPPGSPASVIFGEGVTAAQPGSYENLVLAVYDIEAAQSDLVDRGVEVSEIWHGRSGFDRFGD